jgi:predicted O-methyltransferase YrrM
MAVPVVVRRVRWVRQRTRAALVGRRRLRQIAECGDPSAAAVARAVQATVTGDLPAEDAGWIERIDGLRRRLLTQHEPLGTGVDPGTGEPAGKTLAEAAVGTSHRDWGTLQFELVRHLRPGVCLELGTSLGISGAYVAAALQLNGHGRLVTMELSAFRAARARAHWEELGLDAIDVVMGSFDDTLGPTVEGVGPVDFAFVDGDHQLEPTLRYTEAILGQLADGGVILFDDIRWSGGMQEAWDVVRRDPRVRVSVDLGKVGICVYGARPGPSLGHYEVPTDLEGTAR